MASQSPQTNSKITVFGPGAGAGIREGEREREGSVTDARGERPPVRRRRLPARQPARPVALKELATLATPLATDAFLPAGFVTPAQSGSVSATAHSPELPTRLQLRLSLTLCLFLSSA